MTYPNPNILCALIGNPNTGKSTLFNQLTGLNQRVGNWSGVTIDGKEGTFDYKKKHVHLIDLPGSYQLIPKHDLKNTTNLPLDQSLASQFIHSKQANCFVNVVHALELERHLYFTLQILNYLPNTPFILVINYMDEAHSKGLHIDLNQIATRLGIPVLGASAKSGQGISAIRQAIIDQKPPVVNPILPLFRVKSDQAQDKNYYQYIENLLNQTLSQAKKSLPRTKKIKIKLDNIILNQFLGIPIFLFVLYLLFVFSLDIGGYFQQLFDQLGELFFVQLPASILQYFHAPDWLIAVIAYGTGRGLQTVITFIPILMGLYLGIAWLEDSGYMTRVAFMMDKLMQYLKLPGQACIPLLISFGCNVPGMLASRTLPTPQERILTMMMSPFMSCSARLATYTLFVSAFFPHHASLIIISLYLIGIAVAFLTATLLRCTQLKAPSPPLVLELARYQTPVFKKVIKQAFSQVIGFVYRASCFVIPISSLLGLLNVLNLKGELIVNNHLKDSVLAMVGKCITPLLAPIGITADNWPATVSLLTGIVSKEVMIASLNTLYTQSKHISQHTEILSLDFIASIKLAFINLGQHLEQLYLAFRHPFLEATPLTDPINHSAYGQMLHQFTSHQQAFAYLVFILLYLPCLSTLAVIQRELNKSWTLFAIIWSTQIAYTLATLIYQIPRIYSHPIDSLLWISVMILSVILTWFILAKNAFKGIKAPLVFNSRKTLFYCSKSCLGCKKFTKT